MVALAHLVLNESVGEKATGEALLTRAISIAENRFGAADAWRANVVSGLKDNELALRELAVRERGLALANCRAKPTNPTTNFVSLLPLYDNQEQLDYAETLGIKEC